MQVAHVRRGVNACVLYIIGTCRLQRERSLSCFAARFRL